MTDEEYPLSASQLKTHNTCEEQYRWHYVSDIEPTKAPKGYRSMGSAVHQTIEVVLEMNPNLRDEDELNWRFEEVVETLDYEYPPELHDRVYTCLSNAARYIADQDFTLRGVEVDHTFRVSRPDINHPFRAIMDVCTEREIWDWKTGNKRNEQIQAAVYLAAYAHKYGEVPEAIRFVYLKDREQSIHQRTDDDGYEFWSEEDEPDGWEEAMRVAKRVLRSWETDTWRANPSPSNCYWCDYEMFCEYSPVGAGSIDWERYGY